MATYTSEINLPQTLETDIINITPMIKKQLEKLPLIDGIVNVFVAGSTGAIIELEYEPGLKKDIPEFLDRIIPRHPKIRYHHEDTWHDGNGHSHVRASLLGSSMTIPIRNKKLLLGTWQQIAFIELDNKPRNRTIYLTFIGD